MNSFKSLRFEFKVDSNSVKGPGCFKHWSQWMTIRGEFHDSSDYVWFVLNEYELKRWYAEHSPAFKDGYHSMDCFGDMVRFYDLNFPPVDSGTLQVKFHTIEFPQFLRKALLRYATKAWAKLRKTDEYEHTIEISPARRTRWMRNYGCGRGQVKLTGASFPPSALDRVEYLKRIALNTTSAAWQTATLDLSKDGDGYYFRILTPRGRCSMVGGLINHGSKEEPDWSIHT